MTEKQRRDLYDEGMENSAEGKAKDMKGHIKDAVGGLTGNERLQAEGKVDQIKGEAQDKLGEAQRRVAES